MKRTFTAIVICLSLIFSTAALTLSAFAAEVGDIYYVDSIDGEDGNDGRSPESAWRTLKRASEMTFSEGDRILLKSRGVYTDPFFARGCGTSENPITVSSYGDTEFNGKPMLYSNKDVVLITINNVSGWTFENLEISAPNGKGILILSDDESGIMSDITIRESELHDISFKPFAYVETERAPIYIANVGENTGIDRVTLSGLSIYNSSYGVNSNGISFEYTPDLFVSPEESYNHDFIFENLSFNNINYDAMCLRSMYNLVLRNSSFIKTSQRTDWATAPMYMAGVKKVLSENLEIAGTTNIVDGMSVDFDGWTTDSTYQYVYSHDNIRFMNNCIYDKVTRNANCTVRYCLSVNDNKTRNRFADFFSGDGDPKYEEDRYMDNFKFYNNTIINGSSFDVYGVKNSYVANNIFVSDSNEAFVMEYRRQLFGAENYYLDFDGVFTNNCFYGYGIPTIAENSVNVNPQFVGKDWADKDSFKLSASSKLLGKGIQVENDMGGHDFYGNPLTDTHNIGCYEGSGEEASNKRSVLSCVCDLFKRIFGFLRNIIKNIGEIELD